MPGLVDLEVPKKARSMKEMVGDWAIDLSGVGKILRTRVMRLCFKRMEMNTSAIWIMGCFL